ncbi:MAG: hypothetical protein R2800_09870 [Flavipsychrobacter sp.]
MSETALHTFSQYGLGVLVLTVVAWQLWLYFKKGQERQQKDIEELRDIVQQLQNDKDSLQQEFRNELLQMQEKLITSLNHNTEVIKDVKVFMERYTSK